MNPVLLFTIFCSVLAYLPFTSQYLIPLETKPRRLNINRLRMTKESTEKVNSMEVAKGKNDKANDDVSMDCDRNEALPVEAAPTEVSSALLTDEKIMLSTPAFGDVGITPPFSKIFDPFSLDDLGNRKAFREAEIKHGRVAMLAVIGIFVQEKGLTPFVNPQDGPVLLQDQSAFLPGLWALSLFIFAIEVTNSTKAWDIVYDDQAVGPYWKIQDDYVPGDLGWDPAGFTNSKALTKKNSLLFKYGNTVKWQKKGFRKGLYIAICQNAEEYLNSLRNKELNNGRLAMIAFVGMLVQELLFHEKVFH